MKKKLFLITIFFVILIIPFTKLNAETATYSRVPIKCSYESSGVKFSYDIETSCNGTIYVDDKNFNFVDLNSYDKNNVNTETYLCGINVGSWNIDVKNSGINNDKSIYQNVDFAARSNALSTANNIFRIELEKQVKERRENISCPLMYFLKKDDEVLITTYKDYVEAKDKFLGYKGFNVISGVGGKATYHEDFIKTKEAFKKLDEANALRTTWENNCKDEKYSGDYTKDKCTQIARDYADMVKDLNGTLSNMGNIPVTLGNATDELNEVSADIIIQSGLLIGKITNDKKFSKCSDVFNNEGKFIGFLNTIFLIIRILLPIILIVLTTIDFTKNIIDKDDEQYKESFKTFAKRAIVVAIIFMVPTLVNLFLDIAGITGNDCIIK